MKSSVLENGRARKNLVFFSAAIAGRSLAANVKIKRNFIEPGIISAKIRRRPTVRFLPEVSQIKNASKRLNSEKMKKSTPNPVNKNKITSNLKIKIAKNQKICKIPRLQFSF